MELLRSTEGTTLMVVDVQESHYPHCLRREETLDVMLRVIAAARVMGLPTVLTEHYPKAFGSTVEPIRAALEGIAPLAKIHFSCLGDPAIRARIEELGTARLVLVGAETHICICQTALRGRELGLDVTVVADAVTGRKALDHDLALQRLRGHGVEVVTWEMLVYEWMQRGGTETFKRILPLVKA
jgi:nicotinamidase-related amidase